MLPKLCRKRPENVDLKAFVTWMRRAGPLHSVNAYIYIELDRLCAKAKQDKRARQSERVNVWAFYCKWQTKNYSRHTITRWINHTFICSLFFVALDEHRKTFQEVTSQKRSLNPFSAILWRHRTLLDKWTAAFLDSTISNFVWNYQIGSSALCYCVLSCYFLLIESCTREIFRLEFHLNV